MQMSKKKTKRTVIKSIAGAVSLTLGSATFATTGAAEDPGKNGKGKAKGRDASNAHIHKVETAVMESISEYLQSVENNSGNNGVGN